MIVKRDKSVRDIVVRLWGHKALANSRLSCKDPEEEGGRAEAGNSVASGRDKSGNNLVGSLDRRLLALVRSGRKLGLRVELACDASLIKIS
jgi:hypothetical protein